MLFSDSDNSRMLHIKDRREFMIVVIPVVVVRGDNDNKMGDGENTATSSYS